MPFRPDANFRTAVASEDGAILDQRDATAKTSGRKCAGTSGDTASDDYHIELASLDRFFGKAQQMSAPSLRGSVHCVWRSAIFCREEDGIATAVEAGQVTQFDGG